VSSGEIKTPFNFFRELRSAVPGERGEKWKHELFRRGPEGRESPIPASPRPEHLRSGMKTLASQIDRELQVGEWKHCVVYERELRRLWPLNEKDREAKITQFAKKYGFRLRFYSKGLCAIFDKWPRPKRRF
jgi:hypothetical protein